MKLLTLLLLLTSSAGASSFQQLDLYQSSATLRVSGVIGVAASTGTPTTYRFIVDGPGGYIQFPDGTQQITAGSGGGGASTITVNAVQFSGNGSAAFPLNLLASTVTLQGNNFNSANQLVKLNGSGLGEISITGSATSVPPSGVDLSTVTTALATKLPLAGGTMTGPLQVNSSMTANTYYGDASQLTGAVDATKMPLAGGTFTGNVFLNGSGTGVGNLEFKGSYPHIIYFNNQSGTASAEILGQVVFDQSTSGRGVLAAFGDAHSTLPKVLYLGALTTSGMNVLISGNDNKLPDIFVSSTTGGTVGGNIGMGTSVPIYKLDVNGVIRSSGVTSGFIGNGSGISSTTVNSSSEAISGMSIASVSYIGVATNTVTLRGGRPAIIFYKLDCTQSVGGVRDYTVRLSVNGVAHDTHVCHTGSSGDTVPCFDIDYVPSTAAGSNDMKLEVKSSNATGTQIGDNGKIIVIEL